MTISSFDLLGSFLTSVKYIMLSGIIYFLVTRIWTIYYRYWFYTRQGIRCVSFPMPILGTSPKLLKVIKDDDPFKENPVSQYFIECFKNLSEKEMPKVFFDLRRYDGFVVFRDPDCVWELFYGKVSPYIDKIPR